MLATLLAALALAATLAGGAWLYLNRPGHGGLLFEIEQKLDKIVHFDKRGVDFGTLPLDDALRSVNGDGSRRIVVFSDPYCSYCKTLEHRLAGLPDVTVYTFLYPILTPDSKMMSARIWCANNRTGAWSAWMLEDHAPPPVTAPCDATATVLARNLMLGRKLRVMGTPTLLLANGQRINRVPSAAELEQALAVTARPSRASIR
ncbi:Thioredoxin-like domain-containing protein [Burkholderia sp. b13]|nr:Thioredoxin-like domain-containing protein [Burkholderia sp. b13]